MAFLRFPRLARNRTSWFLAGGFTLIELLTTICVVAILMGLVASIVGTSKSGRLNVAGNRMVDMLHAARQNSLSKNGMTAVIVVTDPAFSDQYRLVSMFQLLPRSDGSVPTSSDWTQIHKWETLEGGVILDTSLISNNALQDFQSTTPFPLPSAQCQGRAVSKYKYLLFLPNGSLSSAPSDSNPAIFNLVDGFVSGSSSTPTYTDPSGSSYANYYRITVLAATGGIKIDRP